MQKAPDQTRQQPARAGDRAVSRRAAICGGGLALLWCALPVVARITRVPADADAGSSEPDLVGADADVCDTRLSQGQLDCTGWGGNYDALNQGDIGTFDPGIPGVGGRTYGVYRGRLVPVNIRSARAIRSGRIK